MQKSVKPELRGIPTIAVVILEDDHGNRFRYSPKKLQWFFRDAEIPISSLRVAPRGHAPQNDGNTSPQVDAKKK